MTQLNDTFLQSIIARFNRPGVIGISVAGSYTRGMQDEFSDVDLDIFVDELPKDDYTLRIFDEKLVSVKYVRLADELDSLTKPERAVWAVPGLSNMHILSDENGALAKLKQTAKDFKWAGLQPAADQYAVDKLSSCAEEAHKIMSGLKTNNESKVLYASWGMFKNLSFAALVQAGLMIQTENRVFAILEEHFGSDHPWTRSFRLSFGMDVEDGVPAYKTRGTASLDMYEETAKLLKDIINDKHREVIENTLQLITKFRASGASRQP
ncbi:MAG: nucleotidyltransferase domain-containing protein [Chloroflexi bacterium]|nr:nucleotidyltransferase domain-containing protein [Chloroflexota bacterium]